MIKRLSKEHRKILIKNKRQNLKVQKLIELLISKGIITEKEING